MSKNQYNLCNKKERKELFYEYLVERLPNINFNEFEENIDFLCYKNLSSEWLNVTRITIDKLVCPNKLKIGKHHFYTHTYPVGILDLLNLSKCLKVFDDQWISYYVNKLNTESFDRISVVSEIKIASKYIMTGHEIINEPGNKKIGKSGREGKCDLAVKWNDEWIYFEINQENFHMKDISNISNQQITDIATQIEEEIKNQNLISSRMRIDAVIIDKNKVLSKRWSRNYLEHLRNSSFNLNLWNNFDGIQYIVKDRKPDEPIFLFSIPITNAKQSFNERIREESKQIPENMNRVIVINSFLAFNDYIIYAKGMLNKNNFGNILAIIICHKDDYRIVYRANITKDSLDFLQVPFMNNC